jgi:SAM-dependent methyltransferase
VSQPTLVRVFNSKIFRKLLSAYFKINECLLAFLPPRMLNFWPVSIYGRLLHAVARLRHNREVYFGTFFFRNRPQLELALRLIDRREKSSGLNVLILGCSIGAETYSIVWSILTQLPDIELAVTAVDISKDAVEFAHAGLYSVRGSVFADEQIFARLTAREMDGLFHRRGDNLIIRDWVRARITWQVGDAADPSLADRLRPHDMVFANNFLCHLYPADSERCLRNIVGLVDPGGYLFVSGVDLDVRAIVANDLILEPVTELIEEIHAGDPSLTKDWPLRYWGLEPFNRRRVDWEKRYSSVFRVPAGKAAETARCSSRRL